MHTEFLVCCTTQTGQPLDTSVLHVLPEKKESDTVIYSTCYRRVKEFNFGVLGILCKHKQRKIQKLKNVLNWLAYIPGITKYFRVPTTSI